MDKYQVLGLTKNATEEQVKNAYRKFTKMYHENGTQPNSDKFNEVSTAYHEIMQEIIENKDEDYYKKRIQEIKQKIQEIQMKQKNNEIERTKIANRLKIQIEKMSAHVLNIHEHLDELQNEIVDYYNTELNNLTFFNFKSKRKLEQEKNRYIDLLNSVQNQVEYDSKKTFSYQTIFTETDIHFFDQYFKLTIDSLSQKISSYEKEYPTLAANIEELEKRLTIITKTKYDLKDLFDQINERLEEEMNKYRNSKEHFRDTMENILLAPSEEDPNKPQEKEVYDRMDMTNSQNNPSMKTTLENPANENILTEENGTNFQNQFSEEKSYKTKEESYFHDLMEMTDLKR